MGKLPNYDPSEHTHKLHDFVMTRREMLRKTGMGMGAMSLSMLLRGAFSDSSAFAADVVRGASGATAAAAGSANSPLAPKLPPLPAKAQHVIHIFAGGGPSHVDTFDPKPSLAKY